MAPSKGIIQVFLVGMVHMEMATFSALMKHIDTEKKCEV